MQIDTDQIKFKFPGLIYIPEKKRFTGYINVERNDRYYIDLHLPEKIYHFPKVFETDERIPRKFDRHVNNDNSLCFTTQAKAQIYLKSKPPKLSSFIGEVVVPYLNHNSYYEIHKEYKEEFSHGIMGIIEGYFDILKIKDLKRITQLLIDRVNGKKLRLFYTCYCGENNFKKCNGGAHVRAYRDFRLIEKETLIFDLNNCFFPLINELKKKKTFQMDSIQ